MKREVGIGYVRAAQRELRTASIAIDALKNSLIHDPALLKSMGLERADLAGFESNLDVTYLIRIFAVFEAVLRNFWTLGIQRNTSPNTTDLLNAIAARRGVSADVLDEAHRVRQFRNSVVHEGSEAIVSVTAERASHILARFIGRLPPQW